MKCETCGSELFKSDVDRGLCPYCYSIILDEYSDANSDEIASSLETEWGIDANIAKAIVGNNLHNMMDKNMFITIDGDVLTAKDQEELREIMLKWLLDDKESIANIEYIFVDGISKGLEVDIKFTDDIIPEQLMLEELHSGSETYE